jgi:hypothetical protein
MGKTPGHLNASAASAPSSFGEVRLMHGFWLDIWCHVEGSFCWDGGFAVDLGKIRLAVGHKVFIELKPCL